MRFVIVIFLFLQVSLSGYAQLEQAEIKMKADFDRLLQAESDSAKLQLCQQIESAFVTVLQSKESFDYDFARLNRMGKLRSPDSKFRIYNWNCALSDGSYRYFGLVQILSKKGAKVIVLHDKSEADYFTSYHSDNWPGALYYRIIPFKAKGGDNYLLLAWDGNNMTSNKKLIEVLSFEKNGIQFGKPLILWKGKSLSRVVFEYAKQASMSIEYNEKKKQLIFDHLAPSSPMYQNQLEYYGPDLSYDALTFEKGKWVLQENVDFRKE